MRHLTARTLRSALAALTAAGSTFAVLLPGCGHDDTGDASASDSGLVDTHPVDVAADTADASRSARPRITLVNAVHDLGPNAGGVNNAVRLCFAQGTTNETLSVLPLPALPEGLGIAAGRGEPVATVGVDFARRIVVPFVVNASRISLRGGDPSNPASEATCDQLIGDAAIGGARLTLNVDYWPMPAVQPGAIVDDRAYVIVLSGCVGRAQTPNPGKCGVGFLRSDDPSTGNLSLTVYVPTATPVAAPFGAQLLYASSQANAYFSQAGTKGSIRPGFFAGPVDGGTFQPITEPNPILGSLSKVTAVPDVPGSDGFALGPGLFPSTLAEIRERSDLTRPSPPFPGNRNYVFIAIGDPDPIETFPWIKGDGSRGQDGGIDGSQFNLRSFHFIAFPADGR